MRNVLENLLLDAGERDHLVARAPKQLGHGCRPRGRARSHQAFESGKDAFLRSTNSHSSSSTASSIGGASYSASIFFQVALARTFASWAPSRSHCSKLPLSAFDERQNALSKFASVCGCPRKCTPGSFVSSASSAWPFGDMSTPFASECHAAAWSTSRMNFSYPIARPPSSQPAVWRTKLTP